jgi:CHAT domain-containing protein/tetratricopeptide (TPR) repeat protein
MLLRVALVTGLIVALVVPQPVLSAVAQNAQDAAGGLAEAAAAESSGQERYRQGDLTVAERLLRRALRLREEFAPDSLAVAESLHDLGKVVERLGNLATAREFHQRALALREKLAPHSLPVADSLNELGEVAREQGDMAAAKEYLHRALALGEKRALGSLAVATSLHYLGNLALVQGDLPGAKTFYQRALTLREKLAPNSLDYAVTLNNLGNVAWSEGDLAAARRLFQRTLALREKLAPGSLSVAGVLNNLAGLAFDQGELAPAKELFQRCLAIQEKLAPGSLEVADSLSNLGAVTRSLGDLASARQFLQHALAIYQKLAPSSPGTARILENLGNIALDQGDLAAAEAIYKQTLTLREKLAPNSLDVAGSLTSLGVVAGRRGDLIAAKQLYERALRLQEKVAPHSLDMAQLLNNLGDLVREQGDMATARELLQRALAMKEKLAPDSLDVANTLTNLGIVAEVQGDHAAASELHWRALEIRTRKAPDSPVVADSLNNLGVVAFAQGNLALAREFYQRGLAIQEKVAPDSLDVAMSLNNLGNVASIAGDPALAKTLLQRALAIDEKLAPDSLAVAERLNNLGENAGEQGDLAAATAYHERALALRKRLAPGSLDVAKSLNNLARLTAKRGDWAASERLAGEAWRVVRRQAAAVTGDEARRAFGAFQSRYAAGLIRAQVALGQPASAFTTLEESRAQALQQLLLERRLAARVTDQRLWAAYEAAVAGRNRAEQALSRVSVERTRARRELVGAEQARASSEELAQRRLALEAATKEWTQAQSAYTLARVKADELWAGIKKSAPRTFAPPLSPAQAQRFLPAGTLFVAFSVGSEQVDLFLLRPGSGGQSSLKVYTTALKQQELLALLRSLREHVTNPVSGLTETVAAGRALFAQLFPPAARGALQEARRLVISPDGPLWEIPFAALVTNSQGPPRYLGIDRPLAYTQSLTLFAQSRKDRPQRPRKAQPVALVVGDPLFARQPMRLPAAPERSAVNRGERGFLWASDRPPERLPATRAEAVAVARLYGGTPLLGERATEITVRQLIGRADVIHLATHGYLHPQRAMSSGVLLTVPEREPKENEHRTDGFLQAWEIYSELKLRAEIVVLSACETGSGHNVMGEGIVGLTRALQYAGARSIVASQWPVADNSTSTLMVAFNRKLREGLAKDEALRQAMTLVRKNPRTAHPFHWAPFFLIGDPDSLTLGPAGAHPRPARKRSRRGTSTRQG